MAVFELWQYADPLHQVFECIAHMPTLSLLIAVLLTVLLGLIVYEQLTGEAPLMVKKHCVSNCFDTKNADELFRRLGAPSTPHEEGSIIPCNGLILGNGDEPFHFENELCSGKFLSLHRATHDPKLDKSCDYCYGEYFRGKKRLWEARLQVQFKVPPKVSDLFFGVSTEHYVPMTRATKSTMAGVVAVLKKIVGNKIYHTPGDDPAVVSGGDLELPAFVMPLMAFDQYIVTPRGLTPPKLSDPSIPFMGSCRSKRIKAYQKEINDLVFEPGATYTFCFWGISQWLDKINWTVKLPLAKVDFDLFCGRPPVHVVIYALKASQDGDSRHLEHLKQYYFDLAFWSSEHRPEWERIRSLFGDWAASAEENGSSMIESNSGVQNSFHGVSTAVRPKAFPSSLFACCAGRP